MKTLIWNWVCALLCCTAGLASAATVNVSIIGVSFVPSVITITNGDTVVWSGGGNVHTVSGAAGSDPFCGGFAITTCSHTFTNVGSFAYHCNFHQSSFSMTGQVIVVEAPNGSPPTVALTNVINNALQVAPANVPITVLATDADGSIASVEVLTNGVVYGVRNTAPYTFMLSSLPAGVYAVQARATDNQGLTATSTSVQVRVATAPVLSWEVAQGEVQVKFNTVTGVTYVVEAATQLTNFADVRTNVGNGGTQSYAETNGASGARLFRVRLE